MALIEGSLIIAIIFIIVFVVAGVYIYTSVKTIEGRLIAAGFLIAALLVGLVASGIL